MVLDPHNRNLMMGSGAVICLEAKPATVFGRLRRHITNGGSARERPLLAGEDPLKRIEALKEYRHPFYGMADWTVHTDDLTTEEIIDEVVKGVGYANRRFERPSEKWPVFPPPSLKGCQSDAPYGDEMGAAFAVDTASAKYPVFVGWGILDQLGRRMRELGMKGTAAIIGDEKVMALHDDGVQESLREAGFQALSLSVPSGEGSKSHEELWKIYDWLVEHRIERGSTIVAMGGGVVGDLAGYAAATYLRGINLVQVPTTLVAMTDSAIGGKVAINHPQGKNLIGAFYQPKMMLADVGLLSSLPARELTSGWAETIKHGVIMDPELLHMLEQDHQADQRAGAGKGHRGGHAERGPQRKGSQRGRAGVRPEDDLELRPYHRSQPGSGHRVRSVPSRRSRRRRHDGGRHHQSPGRGSAPPAG